DRVCFTRPARAGLWCADAMLQRVVQVSVATPEPRLYREWVFAGGQVFSSAPGRDCATAWTAIGGARAQGLSRDRAVVRGSTSVDAGARRAYLALPLEEELDVGTASLVPLRGLDEGPHASR